MQDVLARDKIGAINIHWSFSLGLFKKKQMEILNFLRNGLRINYVEI